MDAKKMLLSFYPLMMFILLLSSADRAMAQPGPGYDRWYMGPGIMGHWGMGWIGGIFMIVFWIVVIIGLVFLIRWLIHTTRGASGPTHPGHSSRALEILGERYAKGEIDKEEFEQKKKDLMA